MSPARCKSDRFSESNVIVLSRRRRLRLSTFCCARRYNRDMSMTQVSSTGADVSPRLKGREIIVAVCGGIAAYKVADVVSKLVQLDAGITVCMTADAQRFVSAVTFEALSGRRVRSEIYENADPTDTQHIGLTEKADLML